MARKAHGFTIVELLIVTIVIAILAIISIVAYSGIQNSAAETALKSDLRNAATQLGLAYANDGVYPGSAATLSKSTGTTFEYDSDGTGYCLSATSNRPGVGDWHMSNTFGLTEGVCDGHTAGLGSLEDSAFPTTAANSLVLSIATERTNADEANYVSLTGATPWA